MKDKSKHKHPAKERRGMAPSDSRRGENLIALENAKTLHLGTDCNYDRGLRRLQIELVKLKEGIRHETLRIPVIFEDRDAAGKGGAIKRINESLNPRVCEVGRWRIVTSLRKYH